MIKYNDEIIIDCITKGIIWASWTTEQKEMVQGAIDRIRELQQYKAIGLTLTEVNEIIKMLANHGIYNATSLNIALSKLVIKENDNND